MRARILSSSSIKEISVRGLGDYIREQRRTAQISLRQLARQAGVSNPYLSQIERGLRKPSAEILQQIAKALRISAEALYVQAGILEEREGTELAPGRIPDLAREEVETRMGECRPCLVGDEEGDQGQDGQHQKPADQREKPKPLVGELVVAGLEPPVPFRATRLAQGLLTPQGEIVDPLDADREDVTIGGR